MKKANEQIYTGERTTYLLNFFTRLSFTRTRTSRVGAMSAVMTAQIFTRISAAATPSG